MIKVAACVSALLAQSHNLVKHPIVRMSSSTTNAWGSGAQSGLDLVKFNSTIEVKVGEDVLSSQGLKLLYNSIRSHDGCRWAFLFLNSTDPSLYTIATKWNSFEAYSTCMRENSIINGVTEWGIIKIGIEDF